MIATNANKKYEAIIIDKNMTNKDITQTTITTTTTTTTANNNNNNNNKLHQVSTINNLSNDDNI